jgi:predicted XRE-type DNA-binding protein
MSKDDMDLVRGSGNLFEDFETAEPELRQLKALLAAEVIKTLDQRKLTVRKAEAITHIAAADFSRIRKVKLDRFTIDRLMTILDRLGQDVQVSVSVRTRTAAG